MRPVSGIKIVSFAVSFSIIILTECLLLLFDFGRVKECTVQDNFRLLLYVMTITNLYYCCEVCTLSNYSENARVSFES